ncbi:hypothetical protein [Azospirillum doebereinerae]
MSATQSHSSSRTQYKPFQSALRRAGAALCLAAPFHPHAGTGCNS